MSGSIIDSLSNIFKRPNKRNTPLKIESKEESTPELWMCYKDPSKIHDGPMQIVPNPVVLPSGTMLPSSFSGCWKIKDTEFSFDISCMYKITDIHNGFQCKINRGATEVVFFRNKDTADMWISGVVYGLILASKDINKLIGKITIYKLDREKEAQLLYAPEHPDWNSDSGK